MKKITLLTSILGVALVLLSTSCKKEETTAVDKTPVLGENFNYVVAKNVVSFTTTLTGNVWFTNGGTDYPTVDQKVDVPFAEAGTYSFTCSILDGAATLTSTAFDVEVLLGDTTVFDTDEWIALTNGYNKSKTWVLDAEGKVLPGPLSFLGTSWDFVAGENADDVDAWLWDADAAWTFEPTPKDTRMELPGTDGYGTMTFDLINGKNFTADKKKEAAEAGTYVVNWETKTITITGGTILRSYKPYAQVKDDPACEGDDCATHEEDGIVGISDWVNYKVYSVSDTLLQLAVSRDQDVHGEGVAWLIYNFVEKDIYDNWTEVKEEFTYSEAVKTSFTAADLEGTWKYDDIPQGWVGWTKTGDQGTTIPAHLFETWTSRADVVTSIESWGATSVDSTFTANDAAEFVFNNDGSCTLNGVANTYTVTDGVITFGTALAETEFVQVWIAMTGTELKVVDFTKQGPEDALTDHAFTGLWLGQQNDGKDEYKCVQLVKQ